MNHFSMYRSLRLGVVSISILFQTGSAVASQEKQPLKAVHAVAVKPPSDPAPSASVGPLPVLPGISVLTATGQSAVVTATPSAITSCAWDMPADVRVLGFAQNGSVALTTKTTSVSSYKGASDAHLVNQLELWVCGQSKPNSVAAPPEQVIGGVSPSGAYYAYAFQASGNHVVVACPVAKKAEACQGALWLSSVPSQGSAIEGDSQVGDMGLVVADPSVITDLFFTSDQTFFAADTAGKIGQFAVSDQGGVFLASFQRNAIQNTQSGVVIQKLAVSSDGKWIAALGASSAGPGLLQIWEVSTAKMVHTESLSFQSGHSAQLQFSTDGTQLFVLTETSGYALSVGKWNSKMLIQATVSADTSMHLYPGSVFALFQKNKQVLDVWNIVPNKAKPLLPVGPAWTVDLSAQLRATEATYRAAHPPEPTAAQRKKNQKPSAVKDDLDRLLEAN